MRPADDTIELKLPSHPRYLAVTRALLSHVGRLMEFDEASVHGIVQAVDEAITNIIRHSYEMDFTREILVRCRLTEERLEIRIRDFGRKTDVKSIKPRERHDLEPGGLGVRLIRAYMDEVVYDLSADPGNELKLVKFKAGKGDAGVVRNR